MLHKLIVPIALTMPLILNAAQAGHEYGKPLPPGIQKQVDRGKGLPPGWEKKLHRGEILDESVFGHGRRIGPIDDHGYAVYEIEDRVVRLIWATREIVDVLR